MTVQWVGQIEKSQVGPTLLAHPPPCRDTRSNNTDIITHISDYFFRAV